jgi:hypothetical protein
MSEKLVNLREDLLDAHLARLDAALFGPQHTRRRLLDEARAGLVDACAAYCAAGYPEPEAAALAVRDFGSVAAVRPAFQAELFAVQARRTAVVLVVKIPMLAALWWGMWLINPQPHWTLLPTAAQVATQMLGALACVVALVGSVAASGLGERRQATDGWFSPALVVPSTVVSTGLVLGGILVQLVPSLAGMSWPPMLALPVLTVAFALSLVRSARRCRLAAPA